MFKTLILTTLTLIVSPLANAHEGHGAPGAAQAQHGGVIKNTKELYIELVSRGKDVMIYPMNHDFKAVPLADIKLTATAKLPRGKSAEHVTFKPMTDSNPAKSHFHGTYDSKGAHRYELQVTMEYKGKQEKAVFQIESK